MTRRALTLGLLVSVGVNLGVLGAIGAGRFADRGGAGAAAPAAEPPASSPAGPDLSEPAAEGPLGIDGPDLGGTVDPAQIGDPERGQLPDDDPGQADARETGQPAAGGPVRDDPVRGVRSERGEPAIDGPVGPGEPGQPAAEAPGLHGPRWRSGMPGAPPVERLADRLGLEGETRDRFLAVQRRWFESLLETRRERHRLASELRRELASDRPDRTRIAGLVERLGAAYAAGEAATAEAVLDSRALLDPRQQERYGRFLRHLAERDGPPHRPPRRRR